MSLGSTGVPIACPAGDWTVVATAKASVYLQSLSTGRLCFAMAAAKPGNPPGALQGYHPFECTDGIIPVPDIDATKNVYVWPFDNDAKIVVTAG